MRNAILLALAAWALAPGACRPDPPQTVTPVDAPTLLLVSIDGFRADYLERHELPNLQRLAAAGVHAPRGMITVFPSKTFPAHYSIATGLYPEHHGIVSNSFHDPEWDAWFKYKDPDAVTDARWWGGEPIWVTAEKQGVRAATYFWVGSEAAIEGVRPSYWKRYDSGVSGAKRVDQVLEWLGLPEAARPRLVTLYFSEVDSAGHRYGPDSPEVGSAARRVDGHLGRLLEGLEQRGLRAVVDLIVLSDHGMAPTSTDRVIVLDDYIDLSDVMIVDTSPVLMLRPREGKGAAVHAALEHAHPRLRIYRKGELPGHLHFAGHRRIPPLIGIAEEGWSVVSDRGLLSRWVPRGMHGWDPRLDSMRALFVADGPSFRDGLKVEPFESVHLYELMAEVLGLAPAPNDGRLAAVAHLLDDASRESPAAPRSGRR